MFTVKIWRDYIYRVRCTAYTDHKSLRYLMDQPNMNMMQSRWLDVVKDYDCTILYHPDKVNVVADALSHKLARSLVREICMRIFVDSPFLDLIREAHAEGVQKENWKHASIRGRLIGLLSIVGGY